MNHDRPSNPPRKDRRALLMKAAMKHFALHGYLRASLRDISDEAGANVALIGYYFGNKAGLYRETFHELFKDLAEPLLKIASGVRDQASWEAALRQWVVQLLELTTSTEAPACYAARLVAKEMVNQTDGFAEANAALVSMRRVLQRLIRMASDDTTETILWTNSLVTQVLVYLFCPSDWIFRLHDGPVEREAWLRTVAEHMLKPLFAELRFKRHL